MTSPHVFFAAAVLMPALFHAHLVQAQAAQNANAVRAPKYVVEPCCNLCSRARDPAAYTTRFLQTSRTLIEGRDGWLFRSETDLRTQFGHDEQAYAELRRLREGFKRRGVDLVMVYQPPRGLMHADRLPDAVRASYDADRARESYISTLRRFRELGITVPSIESLFDQKNAEGYFFRADHHWTPTGARRTARVTADAIARLPSYKTIPRKTFRTRRTGVWDKSGSLHKVAKSLCGAGYADQWVEQFVTEAEGESDLFGAQTVPQVTLVGTSNSGSHYNFGGFLSEHLGVDILEFDVIGGGFDGALMSYLPTEEFQKSPPKILIWELAPHHRISKPQFFREVIPLITDGCRSKTPVLEKSVLLKAKGPTETLFNGGGEVLRLPGKHYQLDIKFSDPSVKETKVQVWYTNGSKETINLGRSQYVDMNGRFVTELRRDGDGNWGDRLFMALDILPDGSLPPGTRVTAQLCARDDAPVAVQRMASVR